MKHDIKIEWGNQYCYLVVGGRVVYKSKNANKVNARYEQMIKIRDNGERKIEKYKENPYRIV